MILVLSETKSGALCRFGASPCSGPGTGHLHRRGLGQSTENKGDVWPQLTAHNFAHLPQGLYIPIMHMYENALNKFEGEILISEINIQYQRCVTCWGPCASLFPIFCSHGRIFFPGSTKWQFYSPPYVQWSISLRIIRFWMIQEFMWLWSHPGHTKANTGGFLKQTVSLFVSTPTAMAEKLLFNNEYWEEVFGTNKPKLSFEERLHLIISLLIILVARFLSFLFTCKVEEVRNRTSRFMGHTPTASTPDEQFAPRAQGCSGPWIPDVNPVS